MQKKSVKKRVLLIIAAAVLVLAMAVLAFAYFSTRAYVVSSDGSKKFARLGMELNTFFDRLTVEANTDLKILDRTTAAEDDTYKFDPDAEWGTAKNPYIISELRHLRNLSVLQNIGYFELKESGDYEERMPYFLVCKPDGTPVVIDGTGMAEAYEPIGNDDHPFIGYVGGAFTEGTASKNDGETIETLKNSDQSVIYNVTVQPKEDFVDVGLFGCISYNGNRADAEDDSKTEFDGAVSVVSNLLLYDVTVKVEEPSTWTKIADAVGHLFNFGKTSAEKLSTPHENHHIGILAGHVEYAKVEYISVYYSDENTAAIDITHVKTDTNGTYANYMSNSGIIGFVYNMNATSGEGKIKKDGTDNSDLEVSTGGAGTGGGALSGLGRGYVAAKDIFENYDDSGVAMYYEIDEIPYYSLLVIKNGNNYELEDGTRVDINSSTGDVEITTTYRDFWNIRRESVTTWSSYVVKDGDTYKHRNQTTVFSKAPEKSGIYLRYAKQYSDDEWKALCTQFERERLIFGEQAVDRYYFYDGVFTFALSSGTDKVEPTWEGDVDQMVLGSTNAADWRTNNAQGNKAVVAYLKQITNSEMLSEAIRTNKKFVILKKTDNGNALVNLSQTPDIGDIQDRDDICTITAKNVATIGEEDSISLKNGFESGALKLSDITDASVSSLNLTDKTGDGVIDGKDFAKVWDDYYILHFGAISDESNNSLNEVRLNYLISGIDADQDDATYIMADGLFSTESVEISGNNLIENRHEVKDFEGYFYCEITHSNSGYTSETFTFTYSYVNASGDVINSVSSTSISRNFVVIRWRNWSDYNIPLTSVGSSSGINIFSTNYNGVTYRGPLLYKFDDSYYADYTKTDGLSIDSSVAGENEVAVEGAICSIEIITTYTYNKYIIKDANGYILYENGRSSALTSVVSTTSYDTEGRLLYEYTKKDGTKGTAVMAVYMVSGVFNFFNEDSNGNTRYLRIEQRRQFLSTTRYSLWCATDAESSALSTWGVTFNDSKDGYVTFNTDGTCTIRYTYSTQSRYLNYNSTVFNGTSNAVSESAQLCIYSYEGSQLASYGRSTYEPKSNAKTLDANRYVLWPNSTTDLNNGATSGRTANPSYTVKEIQLSGIEPTVTNTDVDLLKSSAGWKNSQGGTLTKADLGSKFTLDAGIDSNVLLADLFNGETGIGSSNYVRAPIGSTGEESFIPTGCVAFRVNSDGENKARVIVAMPTTEYYYNEKDNNNKNLNPLDYTEDYYFGIWHIAAAGDSLLTSVNLGNALQLFELPRSNTYEPGTSAGATYVEGTNNFYNVSYNGTQYRTYFNGERILVAYEFDVNEEGVYIMGSSKQCDIVYFSVDATASAGGDGEASYKMGTIDYVYDDGDGKVLTVKDVDPRDKTAAGYARDYTSYYYNSYSIMYTQNVYEPVAGDTDFVEQEDKGTTYKFPNVNNVSIYLKRKVETNPVIYWHATKADSPYITFMPYSLLSDTVVNNATAP